MECVNRLEASRKLLSGAKREVEDNALYGLLLALGDIQLDSITQTGRQPLVNQLVKWYGQDPSSGIHAAAGWLLRRWRFENEVTKVDQTPVPYDSTGERQWYTLEIKANDNGGVLGSSSGPREQPLYFTFIVFPPGEYLSIVWESQQWVHSCFAPFEC